jgi:hypothetical protein
MKLKNKKRLLQELINASEGPKDFIYTVMTLQRQSANDVAEKAGITSAHFYVAMNQIEKGQSIGIKLCVGIANGLDIEPSILCKIVAEHNLKCYLNGTRKK